MNTKPLTLLLSLTFLFLFSGSVFADSSHDEKILGKFFNSYKSVTAVMPKAYLAYSKEEKISYVRGQLDGEAMVMESTKHPDSKGFINCINRKDIEIISGSLKLRNNLELDLPMTWNTQKLLGRLCKGINQQNKNLTYVNKTTNLDLINLIYDARGVSKEGGSAYEIPIVKKCMKRLGWGPPSDETKPLDSSQKKKFDEDSEFCFEENAKDFQETSNRIHSAYFHGISDGFVFIFYNYNVLDTLNYLKCFSDPEKLKDSIRAFNNFSIIDAEKGPLENVREAQSMICSK